LAGIGFFHIEDTIFSQVKAQLFADRFCRMPAGNNLMKATGDAIYMEFNFCYL